MFSNKILLHVNKNRYTYHELIDMSGIGAHVKKTVIKRKNLRPQTSDKAPTSGALRNDRMPLMPITSPFMRNV